VNVRDALKTVPWLASLDDAALDSLARQADRQSFAAGKQMLAELEVGEDLYILVEGEARVTVTAAGGERREVGTLRPGDACGEISLLSGELHTATVTATGPVSALRLDREAFEHVVACHPAILTHFGRVLARRVVDTDAALDALFADATGRAHPEDVLAGRSAAVVPSKPTLRRAWRELVVSRRRELPFYALSSFILALFCVRTTAFALERAGFPLLDFLRAAYTVGIALVVGSTATALLRFRLSVQRVVALVYGVGFALILNELSVFLAFDTFYLDMTTRDPKLVFSVEALYRRSESGWAIALMAAFLAQLTFLRPFYRRSAFVLASRLRAVMRRS
jgi:CRP-like cAMP-binding protein